ncbi:hypothetical protein N431DRAFT_447315 [Stipitochalara longipes BDJ]|nr:hypothetical protein N431DRAFT_447315 [Stipitochalara longipes BDJ]
MATIREHEFMQRSFTTNHEAVMDGQPETLQTTSTCLSRVAKTDPNCCIADQRNEITPSSNTLHKEEPLRANPPKLPKCKIATLGKLKLYGPPDYYFHTIDTRYVKISEKTPTGMLTKAHARRGQTTTTTHEKLMTTLADSITKFLLFSAPDISIDHVIRDADEFIPMDYVAKVFPRNGEPSTRKSKFNHKSQRCDSPFDKLWRNTGVSKRILANGRTTLISSPEFGIMKVIPVLKEVKAWPAASDTMTAAKEQFGIYFKLDTAICVFSSLGSAINFGPIFADDQYSDLKSWKKHMFTFMLCIHFSFEKEKVALHQQKSQETQTSFPNTSDSECQLDTIKSAYESQIKNIWRTLSESWAAKLVADESWKSSQIIIDRKRIPVPINFGQKTRPSTDLVIFPIQNYQKQVGSPAVEIKIKYTNAVEDNTANRMNATDSSRDTAIANVNNVFFQISLEMRHS